MRCASLASSIVVALLVLSPATASADKTKDECIDAFESGQRVRLDGKAREAREQFLLCARPVCPKIVQPSCTKWLGEVEARLPTIIISARDAEGHDLDAVTVSIDGAKLTDRLDGRALFVDAGPHVFKYEIEEGSRVVEEKVVLNEGEKDRVLRVSFPAKPPPVPETKVPETKEPPPPPRTIPVVSWVLGGVSVLGLASFAGFGLMGKSTESCVPSCTREQVDDFRRDYLIADVSLGVALVAAGAAVYFAVSSVDRR